MGSNDLTKCKSDFFVPTLGLSPAAIIAIIVAAILLFIGLLVWLISSWRKSTGETKMIAKTADGKVVIISVDDAKGVAKPESVGFLSANPEKTGFASVSRQIAQQDAAVASIKA
jgi:hypothetical protein